ncbi:MAG: flagellar filament outer layer protein FlaA [Spirochaetia bacterium]
MKRVSALVLMLVLFVQTMYAQNATTRRLFKAETVLVENFTGQSVYPDVNENVQWIIKASKGSVTDFPKTAMANTWPEDKYGASPANADQLRAYSVNASFARRGYNTVEINPARTVNGQLQAVPLKLEGDIQRVSVWVWGSNYAYDLDAVVVDQEGIEHRLPMGKLNFMGWRNLTAMVPYGIPQRSKYPFASGLKLKGFVITTTPRESSENFYVYFTDVTVSTIIQRYFDFDGSELIDPKKVSEIWSSTQSPDANNPDNIARRDQGQAATPPVVGAGNPAFQKLQEVSISTFEDASVWKTSISGDFGYTTGRAIEGAPAGKQPIANEAGESDNANSYVYGAKVMFIRRGLTPVRVTAIRPIPIDGLVKVVSVWVAGRNIPHHMSLVVRDQNNRLKKLYMGRLDFMGWRQMSVAIPDSVPQRGFGSNVGIQIVGLEIDTDLSDSRGNYYVYLDDMRAWVDFGAFNSQEEDDPLDAW